jgi:hypothetical protein
MSTEETLISTAQAAKILGVTERAVTKRAMRGTLPVLRRQGRMYIFRRADIEAIARGEVYGTENRPGGTSPASEGTQVGGQVGTQDLSVRSSQVPAQEPAMERVIDRFGTVLTTALAELAHEIGEGNRQAISELSARVTENATALTELYRTQSGTIAELKELLSRSAGRIEVLEQELGKVREIGERKSFWGRVFG